MAASRLLAPLSRPAFTPSAVPSLFLPRPWRHIPLPHCKPLRPFVIPARSPRLGRPGSGRVIASAAVDLKTLRQNAEAARQNIVDRAVTADVDLVLTLYDDFISLSAQADALRTARNSNAAKMKNAGKMDPEERAQCIDEGKHIKAELAQLDELLVKAEQSLELESAKIPNMSHPDVPRGAEENAALLSYIGTKPDFESRNQPVLSHVDIADAHDLVDFENAARVTGNKFYYLKNEAALLELALINFAMSIARSHGFTVMMAPDLAREEVVAGCGFQPRGEASQVYRIADSDLCLVGTAEIVLGGYYGDQILEKDKLPIKMAAFSHCFRREVGAAGSTTRGLYRVHQFSKVEMFVITHPDESDAMHDELRRIEEDMFAQLGLHCRVLDMPTQDLGNPAYRKYDIEAWMPGRDSYGEISSASNCTDYQARRLGIRYRENVGDNRYVHTLNATACAVPRMIIAILETYQQPDGTVIVPEVLRPFMGGLDVIGSAKPPSDLKQTEAVGAASP